MHRVEYRTVKSPVFVKKNLKWPFTFFVTKIYIFKNSLKKGNKVYLGAYCTVKNNSRKNVSSNRRFE